MDVLWVALVLAIGLGLYLLPYWIAEGRQHYQTSAILVLTIFLGWTFLGWVIALVWACTAVQVPESE
jgi:hypothetical protein